MATLREINQPWDDQLGDELIKALRDNAYHEFDIVVAFAKNSGVLRLKKSMDDFRRHGGRIRICVGIDLDGTSYEALTTLLTLSDELCVAHTESSQTFHTKLYRFVGACDSLLVIGSNNMTSGGLWTNFESYLELGLSSVSDKDMQIQRHVDKYLQSLSSDTSGLIKQISSQRDIDALFSNGYIDKEVSIKIRRRTEKATARKMSVSDKLFRGGIYAPLPHLHVIDSTVLGVPHEDSASISAQKAGAAYFVGADSDKVMWFESRKMTGGSRNILDLSKTAFIEKGSPEGTDFQVEGDGVMSGGVAFFGINPSNEKASKDIVINYKGVDYAGNTIKYPVGDKANGTWRLQIKGVSTTSNDEKITQVLGEGGLVGKILVFTKVNDDYYFLSIYESEEIETFKNVSRIVAHNGNNVRSRLMGLF